ncbi:MAG: immune inhibitor A domain-containing protein [Anaerovoracaceae bacterium]
MNISIIHITKYKIIVTAFILLLLSICFAPTKAEAAYLVNAPVTITQPSNTLISNEGQSYEVYATGDEFFNYLHDKDGNVIVKNDDSYYVYATLDEGLLVPTERLYGTISRQKLLALEEKGQIAYRDEKEGVITEPTSAGFSTDKTTGDILDVQKNIEEYGDPNVTESIVESRPNFATNTPSQVANVVIYVRFSGDNNNNEFLNSGSPSPKSQVSQFFDSSSTSASKYIKAESRGKSSLSTVNNMNASYASTFSRSDFPETAVGYNNWYNMLKAAIAHANTNITGVSANGVELDLNNDGKVDNLTVVAYGNPTSSSMLWPHQWDIPSVAFTAGQSSDAINVKIKGKTVSTYNLQLSGASGYFNESVFTHEMKHSFGFPDMYDYENQSRIPVGGWDIMANNSDQFSLTANTEKYTSWLGQVDSKYHISDNDGKETFSINSSTLQTLSGNERIGVKIKSTVDAEEYFVVEYRNKNSSYTNFDKNTPGIGLVVYRVNTSKYGNFNDVEYGPLGYEFFVFSRTNSSAFNLRMPSSFFTASNNSFGNVDACICQPKNVPVIQPNYVPLH